MSKITLPDAIKLLRATDKAFNDRDATDMASHYADDATIIYSGNLLRGRDAITHHFSAMFAHPHCPTEVVTKIVDLMIIGEVADGAVAIAQTTYKTVHDSSDIEDGCGHDDSAIWHDTFFLVHDGDRILIKVDS